MEIFAKINANNKHVFFRDEFPEFLNKTPDEYRQLIESLKENNPVYESIFEVINSGDFNINISSSNISTSSSDMPESINWDWDIPKSKSLRRDDTTNDQKQLENFKRQFLEKWNEIIKLHDDRMTDIGIMENYQTELDEAKNNKAEWDNSIPDKKSICKILLIIFFFSFLSSGTMYIIELLLKN